MERFTILRTIEDTYLGKTLVDMLYSGVRNNDLTKDKAISICNDFMNKQEMFNSYARVEMELILSDDNGNRTIIHRAERNHPKYDRQKVSDDDLNKNMRDK